MPSRPRRPDESFEQYRIGLKQEAAADRLSKLGRPVLKPGYRGTVVSKSRQQRKAEMAQLGVSNKRYRALVKIGNRLAGGGDR